ncbi:MAG: helix-turn-helix domain-containing protein [Bacteroidia bacterium]
MKSTRMPEGQNYGQLKKKMELDFAWLSLTSYGAQDQYGKHYHENPYISLLATGPYIEKNNKSTELLNNGEIVFRPANYDHSNGFTGSPGLCFNVEFKNTWKHYLDFNLSLPAKWQIYKCGTFPVIYKTLNSFICGNHQDTPEHLINWLFEINKLDFPDTNLAWIKNIKQILENELSIHHTIYSLSERVFVHPVYLAACFKKKTGITIGDYQTSTRLKKADYLLFNTKKSITQIALECGFYDSAHFIRNYKSLYKVSPAKFRRILNS